MRSLHLLWPVSQNRRMKNQTVRGDSFRVREQIIWEYIPRQAAVTELTYPTLNFTLDRSGCIRVLHSVPALRTQSMIGYPIGAAPSMRRDLEHRL